MKKIYLLIGGLVVAVAVVVSFGLVSWNEKIEMASESAKEKIEIVKKTDPELTGDAPPSSNNNEQTLNSNNNEQTLNGPSGENRSITDDGTIGHGISGNSGVQDDRDETPGSIDGVPPTAPVDSGTALADIKAAYRGVFSELEVLQGSKVDQVVVQAKADYVSGKYAKEDLLVKYQEIALSFESQADQAFHAIYQQLEADLKKNGHNVSEAVSFKNEYNQKKNERLSHVISELSGF